MQRTQGKTPGQTRGRLDILGLYVHGAVKTAKAPRGRAGYLHPCGGSLGRPATSRPLGSWRDRGSAQASSGGLVVQAQPETPQRNERAFALLELMLSLRARPSLSIARTVPRPDHLGPLCRWLATPLRPLSSDPRLSTVRQAMRLGSAALRSLQLLTDCRLQAPG